MDGNLVPAVKWIYEILFTVLLVATSPFWLWKLVRRGEWRQGFGQRFGRYSPEVCQALAGRRVLWLHAVSVGEANLAVQLAALLAERLPDWRLVVSATTNTGRRELARKLPAAVPAIYYPLDRRAWVKRALAALQPGAVVLLEAEIWPNFLWETRRRGLPALLVNARVSERSARRYRRFAFLFRELFTGFNLVTCPTSEEAARLRTVGCRPESITAVGHPKFDAVLPTPEQVREAEELLGRLGVPAGAPVLVGGSTHPGEEKILAGIYARLRQEFPDLFLVLVPRHFERSLEAARDTREAGVVPVLRTALPAGTVPWRDQAHCLLVDTTGELRAFYAVASLVFIGKTLAAVGGQNPVEPAALGKAILLGPNMQNFPAILAEFLRSQAVRQVPDAAALEAVLRELLLDAKARDALGQKARKVVEANSGALERTADLIARRLKRSGVGKGL